MVIVAEKTAKISFMVEPELRQRFNRYIERAHQRNPEIGYRGILSQTLRRLLMQELDREEAELRRTTHP